MPAHLFKLATPRCIFSLILVSCGSAVGCSLYAQFIHHLSLCPLCIVQRIVYAGLGILALIALVSYKHKIATTLLSLIMISLALFGIKIAYHHVWLQSLPPEQWPASCGMPLSILYTKIPLSGFIHNVLSGTAECAAVNWQIFGINGPTLSLIGYILILLITIYFVISQFLSTLLIK